MLGGPVMNLVIAFFLMAIVLVGIGLPDRDHHLDRRLAVRHPGRRRPRRASARSTDEAAPGRRGRPQPGRHGRVLRRHRDHVVGPALRADPRHRRRGRPRSTSSATGPRSTSRSRPVVAERPVYDENDEPGRRTRRRRPKTASVGFIGITPTQEMVRASRSGRPGPGRDHDVADDHRRRHAARPRRRPRRDSTVNGTPRDTTSVVGVVGIGRFAGEIASTTTSTGSSRLAALLQMLASLNIALFVFNLIPLPPLDGGHVAAALWEGGRRQVATAARAAPARSVRPRQAGAARVQRCSSCSAPSACCSSTPTSSTRCRSDGADLG